MSETKARLNRRPGSRRIVGFTPPIRDLDYVRLNRLVHDNVDRLTDERNTLLAAARAGNLYALIKLKKTLGLRLPEVEARYGLDLNGLRKYP